jgi:predicted nucleotidyltransferase
MTSRASLSVEHLKRAGITASRVRVEEFCRRWRVTELALFGSMLRDDFTDQSDVDLLISFAPEATWSLLDLIRMEDELAAILDRPVDLVTRKSIERSRNWIRQREILGKALTLYAA